MSRVGARDEDDALPPRLRDALLVALTFSAGAANSLGYLALGEVFTANMTGNIVLLGVAAGRGGDVVGPATALASYIVGVLAAGLLLGRTADQQAWTPRVTAALAVEALLQAGFLVAWLVLDAEPPLAWLLGLIAMSGLGMGLQSAGVRALAASGVSTTYVTGTMTALLSEVVTLSGSPAGWARRAAVVLALVAGAVVMSLLLVRMRTYAPILPLVVTTLVVLTAALHAHRH